MPWTATSHTGLDNQEKLTLQEIKEAPPPGVNLHIPGESEKSTQLIKIETAHRDYLCVPKDISNKDAKTKTQTVLREEGS